MELAGEEVTNAFKPWVEQQTAATEAPGSASSGSGECKSILASFQSTAHFWVHVRRPSTVPEEDTGDLSMDVTRAVGGIVSATRLRSRRAHRLAMERWISLKLLARSKRPRKFSHQHHAAARNDVDQRRMLAHLALPLLPHRSRNAVDHLSRALQWGMRQWILTIAVGGIQSNASPRKVRAQKERCQTPLFRRIASEQVTMQQWTFTQAVGSIKTRLQGTDQTGIQLR